MADHTIPSETELRERLTPLQFEVTQHGGTERAFSGVYWDEHGDGIYHCVVCDAPLFSSDTKFESGSGWPSFWQAIDPARVDRPRGPHARHGPHGGPVRELWRPPRSRVPRWSGTDRRPFLHELGVAQPEACRRRFACVVTRAADLRAGFLAMHRDPPAEPTPGILVMPNPWDIGSARVLTTLGFRALATTSAGFAGSLGRHDQHVRRDELIDHVVALTSAVDVPFNVDAEDCFRRRSRRRDRDGRAARRHRRGRLLDRGLRPAQPT